MDDYRIAKLDVRPGDTLVVKVNSMLSVAQQSVCIQEMRKFVADGVNICVIDKICDLSILRATPAPDDDALWTEARRVIATAMNDQMRGDFGHDLPAEHYWFEIERMRDALATAGFRLVRCERKGDGD